MPKIFSKNSLRFKISAVGAIGVFGLIAVGAIYFPSRIIQDDIEARMELASAARNSAKDIELHLLQARRAETNFLLRRQTTYFDLHATAIRHATANTDNVGKAIGTSSSLVAELKILRTGITDYGRQFDMVGSTQKMLGLTEEDGLQGSLRKSVHAVETTLKNYSEPQLAVLMLMMRRHEKDFMLRADPKYAEEMKKRVVEFDKALSASSIPDIERTEVSRLMQGYQADFTRYFNGSIELAAGTKSMIDSYAKMEPVLEKVVSEITSQYVSAKSDLEANKDVVSKLLAAVIVGITILVAVITSIIVSNIVTMIFNVTRTMRELANGNLEAKILGLERRDEVGQMAVALQVFKDNLIETVRLKAEQEKTKERTEIEKRAAMHKLAEEFESSVKGIVAMVASASTELQTTAESMSTAASDASEQSTAVAAASEEASHNVQTVAGAAEQLTSSISEIGRQVAESARIAGQAANDANRTNGQVEILADAAQKIGDVVKLINDIAARTNLLALNATIEAARAGETGRGFAVVAAEVKSLASQTAIATAEISGQISAIQNATIDSVKAISDITGTIRRINEIATSIASAVEQQGAATQEIARNVQQAALGTNDVSVNITGVSKAASDTGTAAALVLDAAADLSRQSETLHVTVDTFIARVRAA